MLPKVSCVLLFAEGLRREPDAADMLRRTQTDRSDECFAVKGQLTDLFLVVQIAAESAHALCGIIPGIDMAAVLTYLTRKVQCGIMTWKRKNRLKKFFWKKV